MDIIKIEEKMLSNFPHIKRKNIGYSQWQIISKQLLSTMTYNEIKQILDLAISQNIYPITNPMYNYEKLINILYKRPLLVYLLSKPMHILYQLHIRYYNYTQSRYPTLKELFTLFKKNLQRKYETCLLSK
jgi:hypothetical protein